jgi:hypothetical protein
MNLKSRNLLIYDTDYRSRIFGIKLSFFCEEKVKLTSTNEQKLKESQIFRQEAMKEAPKYGNSPNKNVY